jgi:hypothetical protein
MPGNFERLEGWERRLEEVITAAQDKPYVLGQHDCLYVALQAIKALSGVDLWPEWQGRYSTQREAWAVVAEYGGDFDGAFTKGFGTPLENPLLAQRGDILKFVEHGVPHLGVCRGRDAVVLGENGLTAVPLRACAGVWKIG